MHRLAFWALWVMVFGIPWEEAVAVPGIGTISRIFGYLCVSLGFLSILTQRRLRPLARIHYAMAAFFLWCLTSIFWTVDVEASYERILVYLRVIGLAWLVWELARTETHQKSLLQAYMLGCCVSVISLFMAAWQGPLVPTGFEVRYRGAGMNENDLAMILAVSLPMAYYLAMDCQTHRKLRWLNWLFCPSAALAVLFTGSRGGLITLCLAILMLVVTRVRAKLQVSIASVFVAFGILLLAQHMLPESTLYRLQTTGSELETGSWSERKYILSGGLYAWMESPFVGFGIGAFSSGAGARVAYKAPHNSYLSVLVELGIIGLGLYFLVLRSAVQCALYASASERTLWLMLLILWGTCSLSAGWDYTKTTWFLFGIISSNASACRRMRASQEHMVHEEKNAPRTAVTSVRCART